MFFLNYDNGVNYTLVAQPPQYNIQSIQDLENIPLTSLQRKDLDILADVASIKRSSEMEVVSHYNIRRVVDVYASVQDRDLAAVAGIVLFLFFTHTTLSVPALMGAIMCMGVATANSILVVSFARERLASHGNAIKAAPEAGYTRFRPVLMTALAMIVGMIPMALGLGDGGEQNAPLGRAVIGGLILATVATLIFVPAVFSLLHGRRVPPARRA